MTALLRLVASTPTHESPGEDESHDSPLSGIRPACLSEESDDIEQAFEKLESGAPPRGLAAGEDPLAQIESSALLREIAFEQLRALHERMDELAVLPASKGWCDAVRLLLASLRTVMTALEKSTLLTLLMDLDLALARASQPGAPEGVVRDTLWSSHARLTAECARVLASESEAQR